MPCPAPCGAHGPWREQPKLLHKRRGCTARPGSRHPSVGRADVLRPWAPVELVRVTWGCSFTRSGRTKRSLAWQQNCRASNQRSDSERLESLQEERTNTIKYIQIQTKAICPNNHSCNNLFQCAFSIVCRCFCFLFVSCFTIHVNFPLTT